MSGGASPPAARQPLSSDAGPDDATGLAGRPQGVGTPRGPLADSGADRARHRQLKQEPDRRPPRRRGRSLAEGVATTRGISDQIGHPTLNPDHAQTQTQLSSIRPCRCGRCDACRAQFHARSASGCLAAERLGVRGILASDDRRCRFTGGTRTLGRAVLRAARGRCRSSAGWQPVGRVDVEWRCRADRPGRHGCDYSHRADGGDEGASEPSGVCGCCRRAGRAPVRSGRSR